MKFAQIMVQVVLVATVVAGVAAFTPYGYFGWEANGCSATPLDPAEYNSVDTWAVSQWWTITFTHDTLPLGGMVRLLSLRLLRSFQRLVHPSVDLASAVFHAFCACV
jgi:hypothetical protein